MQSSRSDWKGMGMVSFVETGMASTEDELQLTLMLAVVASEGLNRTSLPRCHRKMQPRLMASKAI